LVQSRDYSEETARAIDNEVKRIITETYQQVKDLLKKHIDLLHKIAQALLEKETIDGSTLDKIIAEATTST